MECEVVDIKFYVFLKTLWIIKIQNTCNFIITNNIIISKKLEVLLNAIKL